MSTVTARPPIEPGIAVLFGDGAGACIVSPEAGIAEVVDSVLYSDGAFSEDLRLDFGAPLVMNGRAVIMQASRKIPRAIAELLARHNIPAVDVDAFLMHQANQNLIDGVAQGARCALRAFLFQYPPLREHLSRIHADRGRRMVQKLGIPQKCPGRVCGFWRRIPLGRVTGEGRLG